MKSQAYRMALLYDFYGDVLTPRQKEFYDLYYNEDLSLAEIAENNGITRQGVRDVIVRAEAILTDYLHTLVDPYGTVSSTLCTSRREGDTLVVTLTAECVEQIGRTVPIYTAPEPTEEPGG